MEWIVQKVGRTGSYRDRSCITTKRAVVKLDEKKAEKRRNSDGMQIAKERGQAVGAEAVIPEVSRVMSCQEALEYAGSFGRDLVFLMSWQRGWHETREVISSVKPGQSVGMFIGPEGGFEEEEAGSVQIEKGAATSHTRKADFKNGDSRYYGTFNLLMYHLEPEKTS